MQKLSIADVLVDMDGTIAKIELTDFIFDVLKEILIEKHKISSMEASKTISETISRKKEYAEDPWQKFMVANKLGVLPEELWKRVILWLKKNSCYYPDGIDMVKNLYKRGFNLHLATNGWGPWLKARLMFCGLADKSSSRYFKNLLNLDSGFGRKNSPVYYRRVLQRLKIDPECVLMVGDEIKKDLYRARSGGIKNVVIIHRAQKKKIVITDAIYVNDLRFVCDLVEKPSCLCIQKKTQNRR